MPPKKTAADSASSPSETPVEEKKPGAAALRKPATHPSTAAMVREALKQLDSRKGVSSQAIQSYVKQQYPSVDLIRFKHLVRKALKKGIETGTLVRPANSTVTTGATGKFKLAPTVKEAKPKAENVDPNVQKEVKDGAKKPKKAGAAKKKDVIDEEDDEEEEESKPPKKTKKEKEVATADPTTSKVAPAKRPKARKAAEKKEDDGGDGASDSAKTTSEAKAGKASRSKAAKADGDAPTAKATVKRGRKKAE